MRKLTSVDQLEDQYSQTNEQIDALWNYLLTVLVPNQDYHGIMDWSADIREVIVKRQILEEILSSDDS